jgi:hypothetical protein
VRATEAREHAPPDQLTPLLIESGGLAGADRAVDQKSVAVEAWAIRLLESAPRADSSPLRKQRVWAALMQAPPRRARPVFRALVGTGSLLLVLVGATAIASAARGHWPAWAVSAFGRLLPGGGHASTSLVAAAPESEAAPPSIHSREPSNWKSAPTASAPAALAPAAPAPTAAANPFPHIAGANGHRPNGARSSAGDDSRSVVAAIRALRKDRDPARARTLSRDYLTAHPRGALAQEALAISIEAAMVQRDPEADALGRRYLQRYPGGAFSALARRATSAARYRLTDPSH